MRRLRCLLLVGTAAMFAPVTTTLAADLPSRKAAPASYVRICDAYGAGFFYIPGTETCVRLGGYVRAEYQYTPGHNVYTYNGAAAAAAATPANILAAATPVQVGSAQDSTGMEMRGRINVDARTATPWGTARTFVRLRLANTSGIRGASTTNNAVYGNGAGSTSPTLESALIQWAGFTFGVAPENYAFMPSQFYHSNPWTGFPNGMKQLAYTATFGGGVSATLAIEDRTDWGYSNSVASGSYVKRLDSAYNLVGNLKWDQPWGFAVLHGMIGNNSVRGDYSVVPGFYASNLSGVSSTYAPTASAATFGAYAIGGTVMFNLPMLAPGDRFWLTANYTRGNLGAVLSGGGLSVVTAASNRRSLGGIGRIDNNLVVTGGAGTLANPYSVGSTTAFNVSAAMTHYWAPNWRSNFDTGYVEINPPSSTLTQWGKGRLWLATGSLIFSPAKDFDIGLELQYVNLRSNIQNASPAFLAAGSPGLRESGWSSKLRVERAF
jgi:hypothetical protein